MALGDPYATLQELKGYLGITDTTEDLLLNDALDSTSRGIEKVCRRQFNLDSGTSVRLYHPDSPVLADVDDFQGDSVVIETDTTGDGTFGTVWQPEDYELLPLNGVVDGESGWPYFQISAVRKRFPCARRAPLRVSAEWGWEEIPAPVKQACLIVASETFKLKDAPFGVAGFGEFGAVRVRNNPIAASKLAPYVRHAVLVA